ncbi:MAG: small multi-drug export protein [Oscillospiraceae bacterium]|nr:small multi-drug export protein [Oscillospiraceae bacterium]
MLPVVELRFGLPFGIAQGLEYPLALMAALLGNMAPVPFIIVYIKRIFAWMRMHMPRMNALLTKLENRAHLKGETVEKYGHWGLLLFVAIPLPGTGAWTGALIAALLNIRTAKAVPVILIGVCIAAAIMTLVTYGVIHIVL